MAEDHLSLRIIEQSNELTLCSLTVWKISMINSEVHRFMKRIRRAILMFSTDNSRDKDLSRSNPNPAAKPLVSNRHPTSPISSKLTVNDNYDNNAHFSTPNSSTRNPSRCLQKLVTAVSFTTDWSRTLVQHYVV